MVNVYSFVMVYDYESGALYAQQKTCNMPETAQDRTKVAIHKEVAYALSVGTEINDLGCP